MKSKEIIYRLDLEVRQPVHHHSKPRTCKTRRRTSRSFLRSGHGSCMSGSLSRIPERVQQGLGAKSTHGCTDGASQNTYFTVQTVMIFTLSADWWVSDAKQEDGMCIIPNLRFR